MPSELKNILDTITTEWDKHFTERYTSVTDETIPGNKPWTNIWIANDNDDMYLLLDDNGNIIRCNAMGAAVIEKKETPAGLTTKALDILNKKWSATYKEPYTTLCDANDHGVWVEVNVNNGETGDDMFMVFDENDNMISAAGTEPTVE